MQACPDAHQVSLIACLPAKLLNVQTNPVPQSFKAPYNLNVCRKE